MVGIGHTISVQLLGQKGKTGYWNLGLLAPKWQKMAVPLTMSQMTVQAGLGLGK